MIKKFKIQNVLLKVNTNNFLQKNLNVKSFPKNYVVELNTSYKKIISLINENSIIIIDKKIFSKYFSKNNIKNKKIIKIVKKNIKI